MIRRSGHFLLRLFGSLAAGLALLGLFLAWLLFNGPVTLDFLTPFLAAALSDEARGISVSIDHTRVELVDRSRIELVARGVHLRQGESGAQLNLPEIEIRLSARALLRGVIAPTRIAVSEPFLRLERAADGSFQLGLGAEEASSSEDWGRQLLHDLAAPPDPLGPLGYLRELAIRRAHLLVDDRALGVQWRAEGADLVIRRGAEGMGADLQLAVAVGEQTAQIGGTFAYDRAASRLAATLNFDGLHPGAWAAAVPALAPFAVLDLPISGKLELTLDAARVAITAASCDLVLGAGNLRHGVLPGGAVPVAGGTLAASYDPASGRVAVTNAALAVAGVQILASGTVDGVGGSLLEAKLPAALDASLTIEGRDVPVAALPRLWPEALSPDTRDWVGKHIRGGTVDLATAQLGLHLDLARAASQPLRLDSAAGRLAYHDLTVEYFPGLPPARGVAGSAVFDRTSVAFTATGGAVMGVRATGGTVTLSRLDTHDEQAAMAVELTGPLQDALRVLDAGPLHYMRDLAIDPARVSGDFTGEVTFAFPLVKHLHMRQVDYTAAAALAGIGIDKALLGRDLSAGNFKLRLDRTALKLDGDAALAGVPLSLSWTQSLKASDAARTRYVVRARVDDAGRAALGLDFLPGILDGPVDLDASYAMGDSRAARATVTLGLGPARIDIAQLGWTKAPGIPATAHLDLDLAGGRIMKIGRATLDGGGLSAQLSASFAAAGEAPGLARIEVQRLSLGDTDVAGTVAPRPEGGWRIEMSGRSFDATALADQLDDRSPGRSASATASDPPLVIDAKLDRLILGPGREARLVTAQLFSNGVHWESANIDAGFSGGATMRLRFGTVAGSRRFDLTTDDFGTLLRLANISESIKGGNLQVAGTVVNKGTQRRLKAKVTGGDYRLVRAPLLARVLSVASLSGIGALLSGEGIPFTRLKADVDYGGRRVAIAGLQAYGGAIGINASGSVDQQEGTLDFSGTLIPAYTLNSVLGDIPVIGSLLMGGAGQGLFAANFRVAGTLAEPKISVNPLSALAPGALRRLFLFEPGNPAPAPDQPKPGADGSGN